MIRRTLTTAACAVVLATLGAASAGAAEPLTPEGVHVHGLDWRACDDGFECATAEVPRDYARPHGAKLRLAVIRHRALDQAHRIGSIFLNPGGPGGSGVGFVRFAPPAAFQLLSKFDVVGFDPRGVGQSDPAIDCDEPADPPAQMTPDTFDLRVLLDRGRTIARLCDNRDPSFLAGLTTANAARDLDVLRAAVGDQRLTYYGLSWGGMLGETYASLFPGRARALVLDSPGDADVWLNDPLRASREQAAGFEISLHRFFTACAAHQDTCRFGGDDPADAFDDLAARLDATPLDLGDGRRLDGRTLRAIAQQSLYSKQSWPSLAAGLVAAESGDAAALRELVGSVTGRDHELLYDAFDTYDSVERRYPRAIAPYLESAEEQFTASPHFAFGSYEGISQLFWPIRPQGAFYGPFHHAASATPALVIAGTHDPASPYQWGKRVVRELGNARLLTFRGDGHGVVTSFDPCALSAFVAYVERGTLPPPGAFCTQHVPFARTSPTLTLEKEERFR